MDKFRESPFFLEPVKGCSRKKGLNTLLGKKVDYGLLFKDMKKRGGFDTLTRDRTWEAFYRQSLFFKEKANVPKAVAALRDCAQRVHLYMKSLEADTDAAPASPTDTDLLPSTFAESNAWLELIRVVQGAVKDLVDANTMREDDETKIEALRLLLQQEESQPKRIVFLGVTGIGKTFLLNLLLMLSEIPRQTYTNTILPSVFPTMGEEDEEDEEVRVSVLLAALKNADREQPLVVSPDVDEKAKEQLETMWAKEKKALKAIKDYSNKEARETFGKSDPYNFAKEYFAPFVLTAASPGSNVATTNHPVRVCFAPKWYVKVTYETEASLRERLGLFDFRTKDKERNAWDADDKEMLDAEYMHFHKLLEACVKQETYPHGVHKKPRTEEFPDPKQKGQDIVFKPEVEIMLGRTLIFVGEGVDSGKDRIHIRRMLNGCLFHGIQNIGSWPDLCAKADSKPLDVPADTMLITDVTLYAPCLLLEQNVELIDAPGCGDANPSRILLLDRVLDSADALVIVSEKGDVASDGPLHKVLKKLAQQRLFAQSALERPLALSYFRLNEKAHPLDRDGLATQNDALEREKNRRIVEELLNPNYGVFRSEGFTNAEGNIAHALNEEQQENIVASLRTMLEGNVKQLYPALYTSLVKKADVHLYDPHGTDNVLDRTGMRSLFAFLLGVARLKLDNVEHALTALNVPTKTVAPRQEDSVAFSMAKTAFKSLSFPNVSAISVTPDLMSLKDDSNKKHFMSYWQVVQSLCHRELLTRRVKTIKHVFSGAPLAAKSQAYQVSVPVESRYFQNVEIDSLVTPSWLHNLHSKLVNKALNVVRTSFVKENMTEAVKKAFKTHIQRSQFVEFFNTKVMIDDFKEKILEKLQPQLKEKFLTCFFQVRQAGTPENAIFLYKQGHANFQNDFLSVFPECLHSACVMWLETLVTRLKEKLLNEFFAQRRFRARSQQEFDRIAMQLRLVLGALVKKIEEGAATKVIQTERQMICGFVLEGMLTKLGGKWPPLTEVRSEDMKDLEKLKKYSELHLKVKAVELESNLWPVLKDSFGIKGNKDDKNVQRFSRAAANFYLLAGCVLPAEEFEKCFDGLTSNALQKGFVKGAPLGKAEDWESFEARLNRGMSTPKYQVPLLLGAGQAFECVFKVKVNAETFFVPFLGQTNKSKFTVRELSWDPQNGWKTA